MSLPIDCLLSFTDEILADSDVQMAIANAAEVALDKLKAANDLSDIDDTFWHVQQDAELVETLRCAFLKFECVDPREGGR